jgi:YidC/Oxa1 family membrane protein insertase
MVALFNTVIFNPLYNGLVFLIDIVPGGDVGVAVILLTLLVKFILFPLSKKAIKTQIAMRVVEPELNRIKKTVKDKQEQARQMMALYKEKGMNPLSSILLILVQLPVIIGLYWVFYKGGFPEINIDILYAFVPAPTTVNMQFLGLIDMAGKSVLLALIAGVAQFIQARLSLPVPAPRQAGDGFKEDLARSFNIQMRYVLPVVIAGVAYMISAAVALYWAVSNIFTIGQELLVRRKYERLAKEGATELAGQPLTKNANI